MCVCINEERLLPVVSILADSLDGVVCVLCVVDKLICSVADSKSLGKLSSK